MTEDADGWIEWKGGECPVPFETLVNWRIAEADDEPTFARVARRAGGLRWRHVGAYDIIAYRLAKP